MALVNGVFLHNTDMKKFLKNLVFRNRWSDFEIISQESGFDISRRPRLPDLGQNCRASKIFGLLSSIWVFIADTGSFWSFEI